MAGQPSGEDRLIADYFRPFARDPGALGLLDDAARYVPPAGHDLVLTTDGLVAGRHFFPEDPPETVGRKALRVNLSDLAAKGAEPAGFLLTIGLPRLEPDWLKRFVIGLAADAEAYRCALLGGDTVKTDGPLFISITAFGALPHGTMVHRRGAKPGDVVMVTGTIGDAALGLALRQDAEAAHRWKLSPPDRLALDMRYCVPQPRCSLAAAIRDHVNAAMDVSDGLAGDLAKLCLASGVSAEIDAAQVPLSDAARLVTAADPAMLRTVLAGGDDYEILATVAPEKCQAFRTAAAAAKVVATAIGRIVPGEAAPVIRDLQGGAIAFAQASFSHF